MKRKRKQVEIRRYLSKREKILIRTFDEVKAKNTSKTEEEEFCFLQSSNTADEGKRCISRGQQDD